MREFLFTTATSFLITPILFVGLNFVAAQVMQSSSYRIESDSINFGGGLSTSTTYSLESTAGEVGTGELGSTNYNLKAGYQQMHESYLSLSATSPVTLSPSISGITGGTSNGSTTLTIVTDSAAGYGLTVRASQSPAMQSPTSTIADYVPAGVPDYAFAVGSSDSHFGYSPSGVDIVQRFKDNTTTCNTGSNDTVLACWDGLSLTDVMIAQGAGPNQPQGATTTINFRVGIGSLVNQLPGTYTATTTVTAYTL